ncbi:MAG: phytanoyl-CoA dioxygenase family protein [Acidimicrobiales bacterium]
MTATHSTDPVSSETDASVEAALAAGRAHEDAGRVLEAVAAYDDAQRLRPDADLAYRIVHLRHASMAAAPPGGGPAVWPRDLPDPFPGASELPEIEPGALDAATLGGAIVNHGCLLVRGFQPEATADHLREMVIRSIEARDRAVEGEPEPDDDTWYRRFLPDHWDTGRERHWVRRNGGMLMVDSPLVMWEVLDSYARAGAVDAITDYFGERAALSSHKSVLRKALDGRPTWHQDGSFLGEGVRSVDVWLALSHCGPGTDAPGLDVVPRRVDRILDTQTEGATYSIEIGQPLVDAAGDGRSWVSPTFAPGDALFFDERFVHRSGHMEGATAHRYAIESWFFAVSTVPGPYVPILV